MICRAKCQTDPYHLDSLVTPRKPDDLSSNGSTTPLEPDVMKPHDVQTVGHAVPDWNQPGALSPTINFGPYVYKYLPSIFSTQPCPLTMSWNRPYVYTDILQPSRSNHACYLCFSNGCSHLYNVSLFCLSGLRIGRLETGLAVVEYNSTIEALS